jgi:glycosyltransferase involved in cell wall biosynthesis
MTRSIAHVVATDNFAGVERYISYVAPLQAAAGWDVTVIGGKSDDMVRTLGSSVRHVAASTFSAVARELVRRGPHYDLLHTHMTTAEFAAVATRPAHGAKVMTTRHFAALRGSTDTARLAGRLLTRALAAQISISRFVADSIHEPSVLIPNGVPNAIAAPAGARRVLVAQRLEAEKDTHVALEAWAKSGLAKQGWTLAFAGRGSQESSLRTSARDLGVAESVDFLGFVDDLNAELDNSCIFLATALAEPFGLSVVEAMAKGVPVVASAAGAHRETVGAVAPELLFQPGDSDACAELLRRVAQEHTEVPWGAQLRGCQQDQFSLDSHVARLLALYDRVLAGQDVLA